MWNNKLSYSGTICIDKNKKFEDIFKYLISIVLSCVLSMLEGIPEDLTSKDLLYYRYTLIISVDAEYFSRYKNLITENWRSTLFKIYSNH